MPASRAQPDLAIAARSSEVARLTIGHLDDDEQGASRPQYAAQLRKDLFVQRTRSELIGEPIMSSLVEQITRLSGGG